MPDGVTHFLSNLLVGGACAVIAYTYAPAALAPVLIGATLGAFITPDADIDHTTHPESLLRRVPVIGLAFQTAWYPYALLHRHRGISHAPLLGTAGRMAYALLVVIIVALFWCGVVWYTGGDPTAFLAAVATFLDRLTNPYLLAAWLTQDLTHLLLDWLF